MDNVKINFGIYKNNNIIIYKDKNGKDYITFGLYRKPVDDTTKKHIHYKKFNKERALIILKKLENNLDLNPPYVAKSLKQIIKEHE